MIAALPMYDWPEYRDETDAFWRLWRRAMVRDGLTPPEALTREDDLWEMWHHPGLLVAQTCGYPFARGLRGKVRLLGAPSYRFEGVEDGWYASKIITRVSDTADSLADLKGKRLAYNSVDSQSGYNSLRTAVALLASGEDFFSTCVETGSHVASMVAVRDGEADCAAIDPVCWAMARARRPDLVTWLRALPMTPPAAPGLPLITAITTPDEVAEAIIAGFITALDSGSAEALGLNGFIRFAPKDYDVTLRQESYAQQLAYPVLR